MAEKRSSAALFKFVAQMADVHGAGGMRAPIDAAPTGHPLRSFCLVFPSLPSRTALRAARALTPVPKVRRGVAR
jgi:hypothetical protein